MPGYHGFCVDPDGSTKCDAPSAPSGGGGEPPGGRFGESNTKLDECYEDWKSSVVAAKLKAFLEKELR